MEISEQKGGVEIMQRNNGRHWWDLKWKSCGRPKTK